MKGLFFATILLLVTVFSACSNGDSTVEDNQKDSVICVLPEPPKLGRLNWLVGEWELNFEGGKTIEGWSEYYGEEMVGYSYTLMGNDTVSSETISIQENYPDLFYIPTVNEQNEGQPINFKMTELTDEYVLFENSEHDFPQKIAYRKFGEDSLVAEISGPMEGSTELQIIPFPMRRIK